MCDRINETAWELWYLNGISMTEGGSAFAIGLTRNARSVERGGFCVEVHALFSNNTNLSLELLFKESNFVEREGAITGTWHSPGSEDVVKVVFQVLADLSSASLRFDVPGKVTGTIDLTALNKVPMLPSKEEDAQLGPCVHYLRGLLIATVIADLVFGDVKDVQGAKSLRLRTHDQVVGGMDRLWAPVAWPQLMSESYHLRATCGPYDLHVMMIRSTPATGRALYTSARLYDNKQTLCLASKGFIEEPSSCEQDYMVAKKVFGDEKDAVRGSFRDPNIGYTLGFTRRALGNMTERWKFEVRYMRGWWNLPTSQPGPGGTGNSSFIVKVTGGLAMMRNKLLNPQKLAARL